MELLSNNSLPMPPYEELAREKRIFQSLRIAEATSPEVVAIDKILAREACLLEDRTYNDPQAIFLITQENSPVIVGRKILSRLFLQKKTSGWFCSLISASMLLGLLESHRSFDSSIFVKYFPFTDGEKLTVFSELKRNRQNDIAYPYQYIEPGSGLERVWPPKNWAFTAEKLEALNQGELHFRKYTVEFLKRHLKGHEIVYDPACSTGVFLHEVKRAFPTITTIGHDSSAEMLAHAHTLIDECACCDAGDSPLGVESVDVLILRFLNQNVVPKGGASALLPILLEKVKKNGWVFCFGHTPVLVRKDQFELHGLELIELNGYDDRTDSIFQFYAMRKQ